MRYVVNNLRARYLATSKPEHQTRHWLRKAAYNNFHVDNILGIRDFDVILILLGKDSARYYVSLRLSENVPPGFGIALPTVTLLLFTPIGTLTDYPPFTDVWCRLV